MLKEIFGPVLSVVRAKNYDEALKLVNDRVWKWSEYFYKGWRYG